MKTLLISKKVFNNLNSMSLVRKVKVIESTFYPPPSMSIHVHGMNRYNRLLKASLL